VILRVILGSVLATVFCAAQAQTQLPPVALDKIIQGIENPDLADVPDIMGVVQIQGIAFDLGQEQLSAILAAGNKGRRNPVEMAAFIAACWNVCQPCQARLFAPMSLDELLTTLKRRHDNDLLLQEVRARHVKDLDISEGTANVLRASGANEELVALLVPDDKVPTIPLIGYNTLELKHAEDYDPSASEGWLKVTAELPPKSSSEFVFKHNSLFGRALTGGEPTILGAYFNKPAPRNTDIEHLEFNSNLEGGGVTGSDEKRSGGLLGIVKGKPKDEKAKDAPVLEVTSIGGDADGRQAFQIRLANNQISPQQYSFTVRWRMLTAPKVPAPAPAKPARPAKK
jgi:hypothetical protein